MEPGASLLFHKGPPLVPVFSQIISFHGLRYSFFKIHFNINFRLHRSLSRDLSSPGFLTKILFAFSFSTTHSTWAAHLPPSCCHPKKNLLRGRDYKVLIMKLFSVSRHFLTPSTLFSNTLSLCSFFNL